MSGIVLSASVRQNLLSLQSTASLLSTTQNDLATGNKVNSALDNPTEFFTAQGLNNRAGDINNLLDGIGNGVQVLQAANTGITSLQSLVASAQSIANQVLQSPVGYSTKSNVTSAAITGATADNLLGTSSTPADAIFTGTAATATTTGSGFTNTAASLGSPVGTISGTANPNTLLTDLSPLIDPSSSFTVNGLTISFSLSPDSGSSSTGYNINLGADDIGQILFDIDSITGNTLATASNVNGSGQIQLNTGTANDLTLVDGAGGPLAILGLSPGLTTRGGGGSGTTALTGATLLSGSASGSGALSTGFAAGNTITVDGQTLTFEASGASGANQINVADNVTTLLSKIDGLSGGSGSSVSGGAIKLHTGTTADLSISSSNTAALAALGLSGGVTQARGGTSTLSGETLTIAATNSSSTATNLTFGTGNGQISTLNGLNTALAANDLQASISSTGAINIVTSNDAASSTIGAISGSAVTTSGAAFASLASGGAAPVADPNSQATRASLVAQYNNVLQQINTTSQDSSFNGINLLNGDTLNLTFDETGASKLAITGVTFNDAGLGLSSLTAGSAFLDNKSANAALTTLTAASTTLRTEATSLGSNLSIVQIRQDFNKNLINVLQTGSSNLTLADTNQEAANSQALSTRQSIAVSALSLANQSQQSVLQLLR